MPSYGYNHLVYLMSVLKLVHRININVFQSVIVFNMVYSMNCKWIYTVPNLGDIFTSVWSIFRIKFSCCCCGLLYKNRFSVANFFSFYPNSRTSRELVSVYVFRIYPLLSAFHFQLLLSLFDTPVIKYALATAIRLMFSNSVCVSVLLWNGPPIYDFLIVESKSHSFVKRTAPGRTNSRPGLVKSILPATEAQFAYVYTKMWDVLAALSVLYFFAMKPQSNKFHQAPPRPNRQEQHFIIQFIDRMIGYF